MVISTITRNGVLASGPIPKICVFLSVFGTRQTTNCTPFEKPHVSPPGQQKKRGALLARPIQRFDSFKAFLGFRPAIKRVKECLN